jgi:hypothetical protein
LKVIGILNGYLRQEIPVIYLTGVCHDLHFMYLISDDCYI